MTNKNIDTITELQEVFEILAKAFCEIETPTKNYFIQEAEIKVLGIQTRLLAEKIKGLDA